MRNLQTSHRSTRRSFLRGTGIVLALPMLESLLPRSIARAETSRTPPIRTAFLHFPNGMWEKAWVPKNTGRNYTLSPILEPLASIRDDVLVLTGLDKQHSRQGDGHYSKTANFLTGMPVYKTTGKDISAGGVSVDQLIAQSLKGVTPVSSLVLGVYPVSTGVDRSVGFTHAYGSYISWETPSRPITPEINPKVVYASLFENPDSSGGMPVDSCKNLLDYVLADARDLRTRLGRDDQHKMDEYLDSVRSVESRIEFATRGNHPSTVKSLDPAIIAAAKPEDPSDFREHISIMLDLVALAFRTDVTRVASVMLASGLSTQSFSFIDGVIGEHHELSHHENNEHKIEQYAKITQWYVAQYVRFLERLKSIPDGDGTLLDNCMIMFGSGMSDGNRHDPDNLPILLGGRAGGTINTGQHIAATKGSVPLCNLYVSMLERMGIEVASFGDSTGGISC